MSTRLPASSSYSIVHLLLALFALYARYDTIARLRRPDLIATRKADKLRHTRSASANMADEFQFAQGHSTNWGTNINGWTQSVRNYTQANIAGCNSKSEFVKDLGKNFQGIKDQVKNDYEDSTLRKESRLNASKGIGYEDEGTFHHSMRSAWDQFLAVADGKIEEEIPTWPSWTQPKWVRIWSGNCTIYS